MSLWTSFKDFLVKSDNPLQNFSLVVKNAHHWKKITNLALSRETSPLGKGDPSFLFGISTSTYQDSGARNCPHSQWSSWEKQFMPESNTSGESANFFHLYKTDLRQILDRLHLLGVNSYRFSIEWSHIEPKEGEVNLGNLLIYVNLCQALRDEGIAPMVTLHHFSEPQWFHDKGSFEKEENIPFFINYSTLVFSHLTQLYQGKPLVEYFCTVNEPSVEALCRYILGKFSPGLKWNFSRAGTFLKGILKGHCSTYTTLKEIALKQELHTVKIGFTHQYLSFNALRFPMRPLTKVLSHMHESVLSLFNTGRFTFKVPFFCSIQEEFPSPQTDFIGAQFYARVFIGLFGPSHPQGAAITDMEGLYEDPAGLYEAVVEIYKAFRVPVIITENGISTTIEEQRYRYLERALYAAQKAGEEIGKENLLGYFLWSFNDNFEWEKGWEQKFGAFSLNKDGTTASHYKPGVEPFISMIRSWKNSLKS